MECDNNIVINTTSDQSDIMVIALAAHRKSVKIVIL